MRIPVLIIGLLAAACGGASPGASDPPGGVLRVGDVQGSGDASPYVGADVSIRGVVTGDFQNGDADRRRNLGGFYVLGEPDGNAESSDGIFVFDGTEPSVDVEVGDTVEVRGKVQEFFGETQLEAASVQVTGSAEVATTAVSLPTADNSRNSDGRPVADLERFEGMLVEFSDELTVTQLRNLARFGEITLSQGGRLFQFTNGNRPDEAGYRAYREGIARRSILLDDGLRVQNPRAIRYLEGDDPIRLGDTLSGLTGNLRYSRGAGDDGDETWRVMPTADPEFVSRNPRPGEPSLAGDVRVGAFNVLNFFTTLDSGGNTCPPATIG